MCVGKTKGHNAFHEVYEQSVANDDWLTAIYKASETGILDDEELKAAQQMMSADQYAQAFGCSWNANVPGAIYGKELEASQSEGRIGNVPYDPTRLILGGIWELVIDGDLVYANDRRRSAAHRLLRILWSRPRSLRQCVARQKLCLRISHSAS